MGGSFLFVFAQIFGNCPPRQWMALLSLTICISGYLLVSSPSVPFYGETLEFVLSTLAMFTPFALTWTALELLFDHIERRWAWMGAAAVVSILGLLGVGMPVIGTIGAVAVGLLYFCLLVLAIVSAADDLVESRRSLRRGFVASFGALGVIIVTFENVFDTEALPLWIFPLQAFAFLALSLAFSVWTLAPFCAAEYERLEPKRPTRKLANGPVIKKLLSAMDEGAWQTEGLTIGSLAEMLGTAEHKLRPAINQELGFRNFSTFVNSYRIKAAMRALDDEAQSERTILEIAYETGFSSLGPFNRAFRQHAGVSPSEYRNRVN